MRLPDHVLRRLAWVVPVLLVVVAVGSVALDDAQPATSGASWDGGLLVDVMFAAVVLAFPLTGLVILRRHPRNAVAWLLQGIGAAWGVTGVLESYAVVGLFLRPGSLPHADVAAALASGGWAPPIGIMGTFLLLLYPDGRLPSPRWRALAWLSAVTMTVVTVTITLAPGPLNVAPAPDLENPLGVESLRQVLRVVLTVSLPLLPVCILGSAVALVRRFRRSRGVERLQLKWLASAGAAVAALYLCGVAASLSRIAAPSDQGDPGWLLLLQNLALASFVLIPISIGTAILRHRLYDIDVVINRALVYGALTAALAGVYLVSVLLLQLVLSPLTDQSDLAVAVSTLAAAAVFRPVRSGIQTVVDRRFFRRKYDAVRTLGDFSARLRDEVDLEAVRSDLTTVVRDTVAPLHTSVWLRS